MTDTNDNENTEASGAVSSALFGAAVTLASSAPKVPDWFKGKHSDSLLAARELYFIIKNKREIVPWKFDEIREKAVDRANDSIWNADKGFEFPFEEEYQFNRQVQWPWYYAQESLKASEIYFPNH